MITVVNFADEKYESFRRRNSISAYKKGKADKVIEYTWEDIDSAFREKNKIILGYERGAGLWLWKPYFILKALRNIKEGEYLLYVDAGSFFIDKIVHLINVLEKSNQTIMGFELPLLERQFTKNEVFHLMDYKDTGLNQILASFILLKKSSYSVSFIEKWLEYMCDERIVSPKHFCSTIKENKEFIAHREDQSVFSILYHKDNLIPFKDPSQYGIWPWEYMWTPVSSLPVWKYSPNQETYSSYSYSPIIALTRSMPFFHFYVRYVLKKILYKMGIYNETLFAAKNGAKYK